MDAKKRLIVNADDFAMSPEINAGIIEAHRDGILTSTSILANGASFDQAVRLALGHPALGVGVHLNLVEGSPVSPPGQVPSLVNRRGVFHGGAPAFALRLKLGLVREREILAEFVSQIQKVIDAGLRPTHVDTHMHIHGLPEVLPLVVAAASQFGVDRIRCPYEDKPAGRGAGRSGLRSRFTSSLLRRLSRDARKALQKDDLKTPDHFIGPSFMGALNPSTLARIIESLPNGVTELMSHPAAGTQRNGHIVRDEELRALTSPAAREAVLAHSIQLVDFGAL